MEPLAPPANIIVMGRALRCNAHPPNHPIFVAASNANAAELLAAKPGMNSERHSELNGLFPLSFVGRCAEDCGSSHS